MARYRIGVIGCGSIGRAHAYGWTHSERTELVALADLVLAPDEVEILQQLWESKKSVKSLKWRIQCK